MKAALWSSSLVLLFGLFTAACSGPPAVEAIPSSEHALEKNADGSTYTEKDYVALLEKCELESRQECQDADPKGTDDYARRVCSSCRSDGTAAVCCRDQIINGVRVFSCEDNVKCSCWKIWNPVSSIVVCDYTDEVI